MPITFLGRFNKSSLNPIWPWHIEKIQFTASIPINSLPDNPDYVKVTNFRSRISLFWRIKGYKRTFTGLGDGNLKSLNLIGCKITYGKCLKSVLIGLILESWNVLGVVLEYVGRWWYFATIKILVLNAPRGNSHDPSSDSDQNTWKAFQVYNRENMTAYTAQAMNNTK